MIKDIGIRIDVRDNITPVILWEMDSIDVN